MDGGTDWVTVSEAARRLGISRTAVRKRISRCTLASMTDNHGRPLVQVGGTDHGTVRDGTPLELEPMVDRQVPVVPPGPGTTMVPASALLEQAQQHRRDLADQQCHHEAEMARRLAEAHAMHREHLDRCLALAASERALLLERIDGAECRAEQATTALNDLVERVLAMLPPPQPVSIWERWFGVSRRSNLRN